MLSKQKNNLDLNLNIKCNKRNQIPHFKKIYYWILTIIDDFFHNKKIYVGINIVRENKIIFFNKKYRNINESTNIISFRYNDIINHSTILLGDLIICHDILLKECYIFKKTIMQYYAIIIIHGILHLLNFDHNQYINRQKMRNLEEQYYNKIIYI